MSEFIKRHIGISKSDESSMLEALNYAQLDELIDDTVPEHIRRQKAFSIDAADSESSLLKRLKKLSRENKRYKSFIGLGYYDTLTPAAIERNILHNPGWYTQYTPYQAEISQGRLEALINFQTVVSELTGLDIANASLLDEATAVVEAMIMLYRSSAKHQNKCLVYTHSFPQTIQVLKCRAASLGIELEFFDTVPESISDDVFALFYQSPNRYGDIFDQATIKAFKERTHCPIFCATDLLFLVLAEPNSSVDVYVGSSQRFGVPLGYGGPHAAFFATTTNFSRKIPGRIIGATVDKYNNKAYRMALQTREQHIRKDKATSNICTAQALLAIMAGAYAVYHGPDGLKAIASAIHQRATVFAACCQQLGLQLRTVNVFDTVSIAFEDSAQRAALKKACDYAKVNLNFSDDRYVSVSFDEAKSDADLLSVLRCFEDVLSTRINYDLNVNVRSEYLERFSRKSAILQQDLFFKYRSESSMMRYLKSLENKDYSLTAGMIPLGSCTMKLNAAVEMMPISFTGFANLHPFCPNDQALGYEKIIQELGDWLCHITDFSAVSFQPNSGAQGELAGLITIKRYYDSIGDTNRSIALIPESAHGTNPASAVLAGFSIVPVKCTAAGKIDLDDFKAKCEKHGKDIAVFMVTYPSTYGVFDNTITQLCDEVHRHGAQVYMDGANLNAQVGLTDPNTIGADLCHINLHKTFAIPHGGGGPGMGPICVREHLKPFLPGFSLSSEDNAYAVAAAPFSSASILLISYAYIALLGDAGLRQSSKIAILSANYIKARLQAYYPTLYIGEKGNVAHELIIDCRPFKKTANIDVEDIAKRLMDYSFHAPTLSWPVPGTLMIEPTESESLAELDRFCDAMIQIYHEIKEVESAEADKQDNVLKNAPHTQAVLTADDWPFSYSRSKAAYPLESLNEQKFWPSVSRINQAQGDRQLICTCDTDALFKEFS